MRSADCAGMAEADCSSISHRYTNPQHALIVKVGCPNRHIRSDLRELQKLVGTGKGAGLSSIPPSGAILKHIAKQWGVVILFLTDGTIEKDHNKVERTIRPIAICRQYKIFAGDQAGVQNWFIQASLIEPCQVNGIEPHGYMTWRITAFANGYRLTQISKLLKSDRNLTVCSELRFRSACCQGSFYH